MRFLFLLPFLPRLRYSHLELQRPAPDSADARLPGGNRLGYRLVRLPPGHRPLSTADMTQCEIYPAAALATELHRFKMDINLAEYAASRAYHLDQRESSRNSAVMRHPGGDKIVIAKGSDGHWMYFSVRDNRDNGTIVDFVLHRGAGSLGAVRSELRPWLGGGVFRPALARHIPDLIPVSRDRAAIIRALAGMQPLSRHPYLETERAIPQAILTAPRFDGRLLVDDRGNAVFPHTDREGPCGYEVKNHRFTGFARGGEKALWMSRVRRSDSALVLAESALDALSHAALFPLPHARYASFAGSMNPTQPALIGSAVSRLAPGSSVYLAVDNDPDGHAFADTLAAIVQELGRPDIEVIRHIPETAKDWNQVLVNTSPKVSWRGQTMTGSTQETEKSYGKEGACQVKV